MFRCSLFFGLTLFAHSPAQACFFDSPVDLVRVLEAEVVVEADVLSYEFARTPRVTYWRETPAGDKIEREVGGYGYARLVLDLREVLSGDPGEYLAGRTLTVTWQGRSWDPGPRAIFALRSQRQLEDYPPEYRDREAANIAEPENLTVLRSSCNAVYAFPIEDPLADAVREILDGEGDAFFEARILNRHLLPEQVRHLRR